MLLLLLIRHALHKCALFNHGFSYSFMMFMYHSQVMADLQLHPAKSVHDRKGECTLNKVVRLYVSTNNEQRCHPVRIRSVRPDKPVCVTARLRPVMQVCRVNTQLQPYWVMIFGNRHVLQSWNHNWSRSFDGYQHSVLLHQQNLGYANLITCHRLSKDTKWNIVESCTIIALLM